jgi:8-oxo-dGTP pyrophosphatase MutT (NUDIX family)
VLLRDGNALEVFLVRRHDAIAFMGGAHVFPGGRVEAGDSTYADLICEGSVAAVKRIADLDVGAAIAHHVGAIRELFEEAGVLLARRGGATVAIDPEVSPRFDSYRRELADGTITMRDIAAREGVCLAIDALAYFAHWVTPEIETRRFDTRFFAAAAPEHQDAAHCARETTHGEWMRPSDAIARCRRGEIALPPPTWTTLRQLERLATVAEAMQWARTRGVPRVQPAFIQEGDRRIVKLPGDPGCPPVDGFEAEERRFVLEAGRWTPITASPTS